MFASQQLAHIKIAILLTKCSTTPLLKMFAYYYRWQ